MSVKLTLLEDQSQSNKETKLGGLILYCQKNRIVYNNTIEARLELAFNDSMPDIRS